MYDRYRIKGKKHNIVFDINISEANKYFFLNLCVVAEAQVVLKMFLFWVKN